MILFIWEMIEHLINKIAHPRETAIEYIEVASEFTKPSILWVFYAVSTGLSVFNFLLFTMVGIISVFHGFFLVYLVLNFPYDVYCAYFAHLLKHEDDDDDDGGGDNFAWVH